MSAIAETSAVAVDDRLAKRNALVLAVAQALAGGNNTVIVSTGGIVGVVLAPDRTLATLSVTMLVVGMWLGTLPVGLLAATDTAAASRCRCGTRRRRPVGPDLLRRGAARLVRAVLLRRVLRRLLCRRPPVLSLRRRRHRERRVPAQGDLLGAGRRRVRRLHRPAARHLHQGPVAALSVRRDLSRRSRRSRCSPAPC